MPGVQGVMEREESMSGQAWPDGQAVQLVVPPSLTYPERGGDVYTHKN